jgi:hypothetical protein
LTLERLSGLDTHPISTLMPRFGGAFFTLTGMMIAPHRANRSKLPTQDRRRLTRYMRRWVIERFFAWIQWQRRILVRWKYHAHNFLGFVPACLPCYPLQTILR